MYDSGRTTVTWWFWLVVCLAKVARTLGYASICDLDPCACNRGKVQCDCSLSTLKDITLEAGLLQDYFTSAISVANCRHVHVTSRAFSELPMLQQVSVTNIARITLEEQAFSWTTEDSRHSGLAINISQCAIPEVPSYAFRGSLRDILLTGVNISRTRAFAFSAIDHAERLHFSRVTFTEIDPQTFKNFGVNFLIFIDTHINIFPTRTIINVDVLQEARFQNLKIGTIQAKAMKLHGIKQLKIIKSTVDYVESGAFDVDTKGDVFIHDNTFLQVKRKAFIGITVDSRYLRDAGKQDFVFENNTFLDVENAALAFNTTGFDARLDWIRLNQPCSCAGLELWTNDLVMFSSNPDVNLTPNTKVLCLDPMPTNVWDFQKRKCEVSKLSLVIKIVLTVGALGALVMMGIILYCAIKKKGKRYINVPTSASNLKPAESNKAHMLVVPDGKTYRETELHVIVEHAEPIVPTEYVRERPDRVN